MILRNLTIRSQRFITNIRAIKGLIILLASLSFPTCAQIYTTVDPINNKLILTYYDKSSNLTDDEICKMLKQQSKILMDWKTLNNENLPYEINLNCKKNEKEKTFSISLLQNKTKLMPSHIYDKLMLDEFCEGPNCRTTALEALQIIPPHSAYVDGREFDLKLAQFCQPIHNPKEIKPGTLGVIKAHSSRKQNLSSINQVKQTHIHTFIHLDINLLYHKPDPSPKSKATLSSYENLKKDPDYNQMITYFDKRELEKDVLDSLNKSPSSVITLQYYNCQRSALSDSSENEQKINIFPYTEKIEHMSCQFSQMNEQIKFNQTKQIEMIEKINSFLGEFAPEVESIRQQNDKTISKNRSLALLDPFEVHLNDKEKQTLKEIYKAESILSQFDILTDQYNNLRMVNDLNPHQK